MREKNLTCFGSVFVACSVHLKKKFFFWGGGGGGGGGGGAALGEVC